jgi:hypothetical protein
MAVESKSWTVFTDSNTRVVGSNPTWGMDVCVCISVFVLFCVLVEVLQLAGHPSKESYQLHIGLRN